MKKLPSTKNNYGSPLIIANRFIFSTSREKSGTIQGINRVLIPIDIPNNDITGSINNIQVGSQSNDDLILFNNGMDRVVLNLENITDFIDDLFTGQASISFANGSSFGDLSFRETDNSTAAIFGEDSILVEGSGIFADVFDSM